MTVLWSQGFELCPSFNHVIHVKNNNPRKEKKNIIQILCITFSVYWLLNDTF
jgi:hypothetical protein